MKEGMLTTFETIFVIMSSVSCFMTVADHVSSVSSFMTVAGRVASKCDVVHASDFL